MKKTILFLVLFVLASAGPAPAAEKPRVAVLDFSARNVAPDDAIIITDFFRGELTKTDKFQVLDRNHLQKILAEQAMQGSGVTDLKSAVQIGRLANVSYIFAGTYARLDSLVILTVQMINITTGRIEKTENRSAENPGAAARLNIASYVAYSFAGFGAGYELFWDGQRVGFEPEWSPEQAARNLQWNRNTYPDRKVEGYYNGRKMP